MHVVLFNPAPRSAFRAVARYRVQNFDVGFPVESKGVKSLRLFARQD